MEANPGPGAPPGKSAPAAAPRAPPAPLVAPTGSPGVNAVLDVVNATAAPFESAPPPGQGTAGLVSQKLGGVLAVVGAPAKIIDTAFAELTAPIAAMFPSMPALTLGAMHLGPPHAHTHPPSLIPPAPPVPLPSLGPVMGAGSVTVMIGGMPAARAGDIGISVTCGSLAPPFEISTGSSNVFIGGARAARVLDITKHCNPTAEGPFAIAMAAAGAVAGAANAMATSNVYAAAQTAADAAVMAMKLLCGKDPGVPPGMGALIGPPVPTVLIGGFPCPPIGQMAVGGILKALQKAIGKLRAPPEEEAVGPCGKPGDPVNVVTGESFGEYLDFDSGGIFEWRRHYSTARWRDDGPLGHGWRHVYQGSLHVRLHRATFTDWDGARVEFDRFEFGSNVTRSAGRVLRRLGPGHYRLSHRGRPDLEFAGGPYDSDLRLVRAVRGRRFVRFEYDPFGRLRLATEEDAARATGRRFELRYDGNGHVTHLVERPGDIAGRSPPDAIARASYAYDAASNLRGAIDAAGGRETFEYDAFHRLTQKTDARGYAYTFRYDALGRCVHTRGQDGYAEVAIEYFPEKRFSRYTQGDGSAWEVHYDGDGVITKLVDPYGGELLRERDAEGRIAREIDSGGRVLTWLYDENGAHYARRDRFGHLRPPETEAQPRVGPFTPRLPASSLGNLFEGGIRPAPAAIFAAGASLLGSLPVEVQSQARLCLRLQPRSVESVPEARVERDPLGRRVREIDAVGRERVWGYDAAGNLVAERDRDGRVRTRAIVSGGMAGERRNALGQGVRLEYSPLEDVVALTDDLGNATKYEYDWKRRLVRVHRGGRVRDEYVYDVGDHFLEKRDAAGNTLFTNEIHENHFVKARHLASGATHSFDYDERGRLTRASTDEHAVQLADDAWGRRLLDLRDGAGVEHDYAGPVRTRLFGRFVSTRRREQGLLRLVDPVGGETRIWIGGDGIVKRECPNGTTEILQYDEEGRLYADLTYAGMGRGRRPWSVAYGYTREGDLVVRDDSARGRTDYEVDEAHRLTAEVTPQRERVEIWHDAADNVRLGWLEIGPDNKLVSSAEERFAYDARDRLSERRARDGAVVRYAYDSLDMLVRVERIAPGGAVEWTWEASYDALGRRVEARIADRKREFTWDGDRLAAEVSPAGRLRVYQYAASHSFVPLGFVDYDGRDAEPASGRPHQVFSDPSGLPLHVEDDEGRIVWWAERVHPFGRVDVRRGATIEYNLRWPGHYFDPETGLHCNRFRAYDPGLARYLQSDPIGHKGSPVNLYAYCSNPLVDVDVLGLTGECKLTAQKGSDEEEPAPPAKEGAPDEEETPPGPPHADTPLEDMTDEQMQDVCRYHADELAALQESRPERRNMNTFSVGVLEDSDGNRRLAATSNLDVDSGPNRAAREYMDNNDISNESDAPPRLTRAPVTDDNGDPVTDAKGRPVRQTVDADSGDPYDKRTQSDHHAEQRMESQAAQNNETVAAQSPSQPCCPGCQRALSQPDASGQRPIDNIPPDRSGLGQ